MSKDARHLEPETLMLYAEDRLDVKERTTVEEHVAACGTCAAELALAREVASRPVGATLGARSSTLRDSLTRRLESSPKAPYPAQSRRVPRPRRRNPWLGGGLLAASLVILVFGLVQWHDGRQPPDPGRTLRTGESTDAMGVSVARDDVGWLLQLQSDETLRDVTLRVTTVDGQLLLERSIDGAGATIRRDELDGVDAGEILYAQVVAVDASGNPVRSRPRRLP